MRTRIRHLFGLKVSSGYHQTRPIRNRFELEARSPAPRLYSLSTSWVLYMYSNSLRSLWSTAVTPPPPVSRPMAYCRRTWYASSPDHPNSPQREDDPTVGGMPPPEPNRRVV
ncbi:hypothetical protein C8Q70DRAFT_738380 [Cubamyces menziesii]|nr:hypothetical protein C8Q70DRAFT_738380 [Cubamyces menziesii]